MQSELEKTELEIAKVKLEQKRHKLAALRQRKKAMDGIGQGAVAFGDATAKGGSSILRYLGRWIVWAIAVEFIILITAGMISKPFGAHEGFWYSIGVTLGLIHIPNLLSILITPTFLAFFPLDEMFKKKTQVGETFFPGIPLVIFGAWYFLK